MHVWIYNCELYVIYQIVIWNFIGKAEISPTARDIMFETSKVTCGQLSLPSQRIELQENSVIVFKSYLNLTKK